MDAAGLHLQTANRLPCRVPFDPCSYQTLESPISLATPRPHMLPAMANRLVSGSQTRLRTGLVS